MNNLPKFFRGELGLAKTYWLGHVGGMFVVLYFANLIPSASFLTSQVAWYLFSGYAVFKAALIGKLGSFDVLAMVTVIAFPFVFVLWAAASGI